MPLKKFDYLARLEERSVDAGPLDAFQGFVAASLYPDHLERDELKMLSLQDWALASQCLGALLRWGASPPKEWQADFHAPSLRADGFSALRQGEHAIVTLLRNLIVQQVLAVRDRWTATSPDKKIPPLSLHQAFGPVYAVLRTRTSKADASEGMRWLIGLFETAATAQQILHPAFCSMHSGLADFPYRTLAQLSKDIGLSSRILRRVLLDKGIISQEQDLWEHAAIWIDVGAHGAVLNDLASSLSVAEAAEHLVLDTDVVSRLVVYQRLPAMIIRKSSDGAHMTRIASNDLDTFSKRLRKGAQLLDVEPEAETYDSIPRVADRLGQDVEMIVDVVLNGGLSRSVLVKGTEGREELLLHIGEARRHVRTHSKNSVIGVAEAAAEMMVYLPRVWNLIKDGILPGVTVTGLDFGSIAIPSRPYKAFRRNHISLKEWATNLGISPQKLQVQLTAVSLSHSLDSKRYGVFFDRQKVDKITF